jgi:hypothetical protein
MKDLTQIERGKTISFFNELDIETRTMLIISVSFFNEVSTETEKTILKNPGSIPRPLFHFLTRFPQRRKKLSSKPLLDHGLQEDNALE